MINQDNGFPLLVIVGMCGAGKSTVAEYLKERGWKVVRFGEVTITELSKRHLEISEANEKSIREELRQKYGPEAYARLSLTKVWESIRQNPTVIDGLYSWSEYKFLCKNIPNKIYVVCVFTSGNLRYKRLNQRPVRPLSQEEAMSRDVAEIENLEKGGPIAMSDYVLLNDSDKQSLFTSLDQLINEINV